MSAIVMGLVWELPVQERFGRPEKYVLLAYADHADQNGRSIYPSVELITKKTGYSERQVQVITRRLEEDGYLVDDGHGPMGTNRWRIPMFRTRDGGAKIAPLPVSKTAPEGTAPEETAPEPSEEVNTYDYDNKRTTQNCFKVYEQNIGPLTKMISDALADLEKDYGPVWLSEAITKAVEANARSLNYIRAVLKNRREKGDFKPQKGAKNANNSAGNSKSTKTSRSTNAGTADYTDADRAAADAINAMQ